MYIQELDFITTALSRSDYWLRASNSKLSGLIVPPSIFTENSDFVQGDVKREWSKWYVDQFIKEDFILKKINPIEIISHIRQTLRITNPTMHNSELNIFTENLFRIVQARIISIKSVDRSRLLSSSVKLELLESFGSNPRCWYSGINFTEESIDKFLGSQPNKLTFKPVLIDKNLPIGRDASDYEIEVDHIYPFSQGGENDFDNLRLSLRWINRRKRDYTNIYDGKRSHTHLFCAHYYWIIRFMGLYRRCSVPSCNRTVDSTRIMVAPLVCGAPLNPVTMRLYCEEHDPISDERYLVNS